MSSEDNLVQMTEMVALVSAWAILISTLKNKSPSVSSATVYFADSSTTLVFASILSEDDKH